MRDPLRPLAILLLALVLPSALRAQDSTQTAKWEFDASLWAYIVPDSPDYLSTTVTADRGWLHLEGRYNYEALHTVSAWFGYNLHVGRKITFDITPMAGLIVGGLTGAAPGLELSVDWWKLNLSSDAEYVIDFGGSESNYVYNWSQLGIAPVEWLELGIAIQRTQAYETTRDIQRGPFVSFYYRRAYGSLYVFNPDDGTPSFIVAAGVSF
jgi:hypothetical protein